MTQADRQGWLEETIARMIACDFIEPTERLVAILWLKEAMAFADQSRPQYPNNVVACVQCKKPVEVNAMNAIHCETCTADPYPPAPPPASGEGGGSKHRPFTATDGKQYCRLCTDRETPDHANVPGPTGPYFISWPCKFAAAPPPAPSGGELNTVLLGWRLYALAVDKAAFSDETMNSLEARIVEYIQALHPAPPVAGVGEADVWLEAGRMADSAGKMATIMGAVETARGQYSLADAFKAKAHAALRHRQGAG